MLIGAVLVLSCVVQVLGNPTVVDKQHYTRLYGRLLHRKESGTKGTGDETGGMKRDAFPHCPERITETSDDANEQRLKIFYHCCKFKRSAGSYRYKRIS